MLPRPADEKREEKLIRTSPKNDVPSNAPGSMLCKGVGLDSAGCQPPAWAVSP